MNPHQKETSFVYYSEEKDYTVHEWQDAGLWVEVSGLGLIIGTISISTEWHCNAAFRLVDENNEPLLPYRTSTNNRLPAHFSMEPKVTGTEDLTPVTFHMIANCQYAKLQIRPSDYGVTSGRYERSGGNPGGMTKSGNPGRIRINAATTNTPPRR